MTEPDARIDHQLAILREEFPDQMDDTGAVRVREQLTRNAATSAALAAYPLANGDEPASVFAAVKEGAR